MGIKIAGLRKRAKPKAKSKKQAIEKEDASMLLFLRIMTVVLLAAFLCALIFGKGGPGQRWYPGSAYESQRSGTR